MELEAGDQITVDVTSDSFDTIVSLLTPDGLTIGENDDGPDGTTNSLLFMRIQRSGTYIIRVRAFGAGGTGPFNLRLTRLRPCNRPIPISGATGSADTRLAPGQTNFLAERGCLFKIHLLGCLSTEKQRRF